MRVMEGGTLNLTQSFLDDEDNPIYPEVGGLGPTVVIKEADGSIISDAIAITTDVVGEWSATLSIPILDLEDDLTVQAVWDYVSEDEIRYKVTQEVIIESQRTPRPTDIVVCMSDPDISEFYSVIVPTKYRVGADIKLRLFLNNKLLSARTVGDNDAKVVREAENYFELLVPVVGSPFKHEPHLLQIYVQRPNGGNYDMYQYKMWATTPQIHVASSLVEDHINKARLENVIPQLEYRPEDLMGYLYRGLALFNKLGPRITAFTGTNMQGVLLDSWVTCSCYYALAAQLQAEGALAFDFSGQSVSLNMDRSPTVESALGRIEQVISEQVVATKKLLSRAGAFTGDGSIGGGMIDGAKNFGVYGYAFAPTTRVGAGVVNASKAWNQAHYGIGIR